MATSAGTTPRTMTYQGFAPCDEQLGGALLTGTHLRRSGYNEVAKRNIPNLYLERQVKRFCHVHAMNAFFGRSIVTPSEMLQYAKTNTAMQTWYPDLSKASDNTGNFIMIIVNHWLLFGSMGTAYFCGIDAERVPKGSTRLAARHA